MFCATSRLPLCAFLLLSHQKIEIETHFFWWEKEGVKESLATNYQGSYSDYSVACSPPPLSPTTGSEGSFLSPESDVSMAHWKQPPCALRWMPWLSTMAPIWIPHRYMPDRSHNKRKRATLLPFTHAVILLVVNLPQPFIPFVVFKCLWSLKHVDDRQGLPLFWGGSSFGLFMTETWRFVFVSDHRSTQTGPTTTLPSQDTSV